MKVNIFERIEKYLSALKSEEYPRYKSWDYCFQSFGSDKTLEFKSLSLAFYLASWGMYRGSSGLLQKNHLIHQGAVKIISSEMGKELKCGPNNEMTIKNLEGIIEIKNQLAKYYGDFTFINGKDEKKHISTTDTLLSKIMLGTLGCVPAYDRYFIDGLTNSEKKYKSFNKASLNELFDFIDENENEIKEVQKLIKYETQHHYPKMKIIDMYFWQIGYDIDKSEQKE